MSNVRPQRRSGFVLGLIVGFTVTVILGVLAYKVRMPSHERAQEVYYEKARRSACGGCERLMVGPLAT